MKIFEKLSQKSRALTKKGETKAIDRRNHCDTFIEISKALQMISREVHGVVDNFL